MATFHIIPAGWDYAEWTGVYYPDDLPEDWRLSYYANDFSRVLLPQPVWSQEDREVWESWVDDVGEGFLFYPVIGDPALLTQSVELAELMDRHFGGFIIERVDLLKNLEDLAITDPRSFIRRVFHRRLVGVDQPFLQSEAIPGLGAAFFFEGDSYAGLREWRDLLLKLQGEVEPDAQVLLSMEGSPPAIETLLELRQLIRLMGLA